ncbi:MAG TPA: DUF3570 domain-containing protein [Polyangiaceae bacterium]
MQLRAPQRRWAGPAAALAFAIGLLLPGRAHAQAVTFDTSHMLYTEAPTRSHMTVYTPGVDLEAAPWDWLQVRGGWEADVVSGASVSIKAGPAYRANHPGADIVSTASVRDLRNQGHGGFTLKNDTVSLTGGYSYSTENDYRSNAFNVAARTDLFQHDTQLEIAYARNFDEVCDRVQAATDPAPRWVALEDHLGCFSSSSKIRVSLPIAIDGFQGSWSQAWTPVFVTQLVYTAQIINGFQSDPYRSVVLADGEKAQEHVPDNRARDALALRGNLFLKPIKAALRLGVRGYWDTWAVSAGDVELEFEKYLGEALRVTLRGRIYTQSGASFWSDDYTGGNPPLGPKGQYWTADRELSPFTSYTVGLRAIYSITPAKGRILGIFTGLRGGLSADMIQFDYTDYTLEGTALSNTRAWVFGLNLAALF